MSINRHNYEEFFLLYVDKELSAADKKAVDVFVQQNPDLHMELALLQQTVMPVDDIVLQKKDWLYMEQDISALQKNLLLYADDELSAADKKSVEILLNTNITAKAELALLQQAKLQPDMDVIFEDKALLYRKEGGRVVGFKWWRVAAAAVLIGLMLWTGVSVYKNNFQNKNGSEGIVKKDNTTKPVLEKTVIPVIDEKLTTAKVESTNAVDNNTASTDQQKNTNTAEKKITNAIEKINDDNNIARQQNLPEQNTSNKKPDNNLPKPYFENINKSGSNETVVKNVQSENNNNVRVSGSNNDAVVKINPKENKITIGDIDNSKTNTNAIAMNAANTNANDENNAQYLNVDGKEKRTALGGFLRKAKRVIERTTNVKTGEGIKIAGFEIALK